MGKRAPASFPFFASDWLSSPRVIAMLPEQKGAYINILAVMWETETCCLLPAEVAAASCLTTRWAKLKAPVLACLIQCPDHPERRTSRKLMETRTAQAAFRENQRTSGQRGAKARWGRHGDPIAPPMGSDGLPIPIPVPESVIGPVRGDFSEDPDPDGSRTLSIEQQRLINELRDITGETGHVGFYRTIVARLGPHIFRVISELRYEVQRGTAQRPGALLSHIAERIGREVGITVFTRRGPKRREGGHAKGTRRQG